MIQHFILKYNYQIGTYYALIFVRFNDRLLSEKGMFE